METIKHFVCQCLINDSTFQFDCRTEFIDTIESFNGCNGNMQTNFNQSSYFFHDRRRPLNISLILINNNDINPNKKSMPSEIDLSAPVSIALNRNARMFCARKKKRKKRFYFPPLIECVLLSKLIIK